MSTAKQICFVIMPFSQTTDKHTEKYWTEHYESFLKPLIEENAGLQAHRSEPLRENIVEQIIKHLVLSPVVVADLTDNNHNVYWELGVRQSFKYGTLTIAEQGTKLASDIALKGTLFYPKNHLSMSFRNRFKSAIEDCLARPDRPDSDVLAAVQGRGSLYETSRREEIVRRLDAVLLECASNLVRTTMIHRDAKRRVKKGKGPLASLPLSYCALQLLATERYLAEEQVFYIEIVSCISVVTQCNVELARWQTFPKRTDKVLANNLGFLKEKISSVRKLVQDARDEVMNRP
jgi:hypothetical protein